MKIYSMTATFGKLEHETLTLTPGLNIIEAPNEWGKSTWCAFLVNMLYGIDTKARSTSSTLADKERYAPWSGAPMTGRIDLNWNGKDITIERKTKGRLIFSDFQAYETETGLDIPELTGANCGQMLLGVERSVFVRSGFLKLTDLPVTQDDALRRRLNSLVTTGDESGAGDKLSNTLNTLKNRCRYNKTGLLPQAEAERDLLRSQLDDLYDLQKKAEITKSQQNELENQIAALQNHAVALKYTASKENATRTEAALASQAQAQQTLSEKEAVCAKLPTREEAEKTAARAQALQENWLDLQTEAASLPPKPAEPAVLPHYNGIDDVVAAAEADFAKRTALTSKKCSLGTILLIVAALVCGVGGYILSSMLSQSLLLIAGIAAAVILISIAILISALRSKKLRADLDVLDQRHPGLAPEMWVSDARQYAATQVAYQDSLAKWQANNGAFETQRTAIEAEIAAATDGKGLKECLQSCKQILAAWDELADAQREVQTAQTILQALQSSAQPAPKPTRPDSLTYSAEETERMLADAHFTQRQLHLQLGQYLGQAETLGQESLLKARLDTLNRRIARLEDTYYALEMAQDSLREATTSLQRRFAPRISKRAQELFSKLTGGRYQRLTLSEDLSLNASAENEDTMRSSQWRSDGTVDQLYLALRLSVAEELTPEAPLVLDDALVRFDDARLTKALEILRETAKNKQVILFTCQGREKNL